MGGSGAKAHEAWTSEKHPSSTSALLSSLYDLRDNNPKAVRATIHHYPAAVYAPDDKGEGSSSNRDRRITSWKMTEHLYFSASNQFPSLARGLFTETIEEGDDVPAEALKCEGEWTHSTQRQRIVARGYDKFFNIDEVDWTDWNHMKDHTQGPYQLTLKSNGCLILISALSPQHVLVASKHSLGTTTDSQVSADALAGNVSSLEISKNGAKEVDVEAKQPTKGKGKELPEAAEEKEAEAHAEVGRRWLRTTLERSGKTEADLASRLWDSNTTAVLELCDDSFEEHVIATPEYWTGLHLHGLNHNTPHFSTAPPAEVSSFAADFGFIPTKYVELPTMDAVKAFTDDVAQSGEWEGDQIEGFVVRCTVASSTAPGKPPYKAGAPFFFKVKFDEPYLLYRQWREITRAMLPLMSKPDKATEAAVWKKVRGKATKRQELAVYADWVGEEMVRNPHIFDNYDRGVVRVREVFLKWTEGEGKKVWEQAKKGKYKLRGDQPQKPAVDKSTLRKKYILVPIAVPGTGKTLIGVALSELFGFGHTQSDDVTTKKTAPTFLKNIAAMLQKKDVVYADRNNHIDKHYEELAALADEKLLRNFDVHLVGIVWDVESKPYHRLLRICSERVVKRGDNHPTLRPDFSVEAEHEAVVSSFLRRWTAPDPAMFDTLINVDVEDTPRRALDIVVSGLTEALSLPRPSEEEVVDALAAAEAYKTTTPYHPPAVRTGKDVRYFGLAPEIDLPRTVSTILSAHKEASAQVLFDHLRTVDRITASPHITLAHEKLVEAELLEAQDDKPGPYKTLWETCKLQAESPTSPLYDFEVTLLVWDDRCMAFALDHLHPKGDGPELVLPSEIAAALHVTVGTKNEEIAPYESRGVVKKAREAIASGASGSAGECEEVVEGGGKVRWVAVQGVKSEGRVRGMY